MKSKIRKKMILARSRLDKQQWVLNSDIIQDKLISSTDYQEAKSILIYAHFNGEVKTDKIIRDALSKGKTLSLPFNDMKNKSFLPSLIYSEEDINRYKKIPEPFILNPYPVDRIDLVILPGLAFDIYGNRIGMGGGFFDKFLKETKKGIIKVALTFDFQLLKEKIPFDEWDERVDIIITEKRVIKINPNL